jgi:hypothetical protein
MSNYSTETIDFTDLIYNKTVIENKQYNYSYELDIGELKNCEIEMRVFKFGKENEKELRFCVCVNIYSKLFGKHVPAYYLNEKLNKNKILVSNDNEQEIKLGIMENLNEIARNIPLLKWDSEIEELINIEDDKLKYAGFRYFRKLDKIDDCIVCFNKCKNKVPCCSKEICDVCLTKIKKPVCPNCRTNWCETYHNNDDNEED